VDGVLIRSYAGGVEEGELRGLYIGRTQAQLADKQFNTITPWDNINIKTGRFILYSEKQGMSKKLAICLSNFNKENDKVVLMTRRKISTEEKSDIRSPEFAITVETDINSMLRPVIYGNEYTIATDGRNIQYGSVLLMKDGDKLTPIVCTQVDNQHKFLYSYYEFHVFEAQVNSTNSIITQEINRTYIPQKLEYETPITYLDYSPAANKAMYQAPSTFVAMYHYEAMKKSTHTSIKKILLQFSTKNDRNSDMASVLW
jgi:hypothetical protein